MTPSSATDADLWRDLVAKDLAYAVASRAFLAQAKDRVSVVREALRGRDRHTALGVVKSLTDAEKKKLFETLVFLASSGHGAVGYVRDLILSMPRGWVLGNIEREAEPYLREGTYDEFRRFLELYQLLDADMTQRLARRAAAHADPDVREAGEEYVVKPTPDLSDSNDPLEREFLEELEYHRREDLKQTLGDDTPCSGSSSAPAT